MEYYNYIIQITRVEKCYVKADNHDEALDKARCGDCECISLVSTFYEDIEEEEGDDEWAKFNG